MIRRRQVEPDAAGLQRKNEHIPLLVMSAGLSVLEVRDHFVAPVFGCSAVQEQHFFTKLLLKHMLQQVARLDKLRENQAFVALLAQLLHHLEQALQLVRASAPRRAEPFFEQQSRVVTHLLELRQRGEDEAAPLHGGKLIQPIEHILDVVLVQRALLRCERDERFGLVLLWQIQLNGRILLLAPQQERADQLLNLADRRLIARLLNGIHIASA